MIRLALIMAISTVGTAAYGQCLEPQSTEATTGSFGWHEMSTAPKDRQVLFGLKSEEDFVIALGSWDVRDDLGGGNWTVEDWWNAPPTHWADVPPPPCSD